MKESIAFIGLGTMGGPMAAHLAKAGHAVTVHNRTSEKAEAWVAMHGGRSAETPAEAARDATIVFTCVGNDDDLRQVILGSSGVMSGLDAPAKIIDCTTASSAVAQEIYKACKTKSVSFLDAPLTGGQIGAERGTLTVMVGGDEASFESVKSTLDCFADRVRYMGPSGAGQRTKMVNQICVAGLVQALAEGLSFARRVGLDPLAVIDVISKGTAQSWIMDNRHQTMIDGEFDFGFAVDWFRKDLQICLKTAEEVGAGLPSVELADLLYADIQNMGGGQWDVSSLILKSDREPATLRSILGKAAS